MIRSVGSGSLASVLDSDSIPNYSPTNSIYSSISPATTASPPVESGLAEPFKRSTGFTVTSRPNSYKPPIQALSLPSSPPVPTTPLPPQSLSLNVSGSSSLGSRRGSPPAPFRIHSNESYLDKGAVTTLTLSSSVDANGRRMVNQYVRLKTIGQGSHGKVWLCAEPNEEEEDEELKYCAIKSVAREGTKGKSLKYGKGKKFEGGGIGGDETVKREVAIMKRLDHKNVVRLKEVIDDVKSKKVFMGSFSIPLTLD